MKWTAELVQERTSRMRKVVVVNIAGLSWAMGSDRAAVPTIAGLPGAAPLRPSFPAVTCSVQATITTGRPPAAHGIVANGLFDRDFLQVRFWEQSDSLVQARKIWEIARDRDSEFTCAILFWQNSIGAAADVILTPAPIHKHDGGMVPSCYSRPAGLYDKLAARLGPFDLTSYWGPMASIKSSQWIASAAREVFHQAKPSLTLIYLPHLDYPLQKFGPGSPRTREELKATDELALEIKQWAKAGGAELIVLSEYGMTPVTGAILPNVLLRKAGLIEVREVAGMEYLDVAASRAFAVVDHQVAHVYARPGSVKAARAALAGADGIEAVLADPEMAELRIDHPRAGELMLVSRPDRWFAYYWWEDHAKVPDFARAVDIHRKPGYDPCELFVDMATRSISMDTSLVKGSHGRLPDDPAHMAFFAGAPHAGDAVAAEDVAGIIDTLLAG